MGNSFTPPEIAARLRVKPEKILAWIRSGALKAINVAGRLGGRPRWRILPEDLTAFLDSRRATPPAPLKLARQRRRPTPERTYF